MHTQPVTDNRSKSLPAGYRLGEYVIVTTLGEGGFGMTYRARDTKLGVDVAIKEYFPTVYADRTQASTIVPRTGPDMENYQWGLQEFLKEARALAKFKHPHIVRVLRFLEANGTAYTIMEYEEGETLSAYLRRHGGVLDEPALLRIFLPVLNGLQAVHDAGLLHLDIKPDNIYLRANEQPMLIDFGSSRQMRGDASGKVTLTPGYCALEQYPGHGDIGVAADVYGMGATLYRCATGKAPIDALQRRQAFGRTRIDPLPPAASFARPLYHPHIRQCIDRALKLAAAERPASIYALQQGLMGKDLDKIAARAPKSMYRPGTGYIGVVAPATVQKKDTRRRYTFFEKFVATAVLAVTLAIVVPKLMIDTGRWSEDSVYQWIDDRKAETIYHARRFGDWINETVFGVAPRPKVAYTPPPRRRPPAETAAAPAPPKTPFGADKQRGGEIALGQSVRALGFLKHGAVLAVANDDGVVRLWDVPTATLRATLPTRVLTPNALGVFASTQWLAAMDHDLAIAVFDPFGNLEATLVRESAHAIVAMAVSPSGRLIAEAAEDGTISVWELSQKRRLQSWSAGKQTVRALLFSPDEDLLLASDAVGGVTLWDRASGQPVSQHRAHERRLFALAWSPDGRRLASAGANGELRLWSLPARGEAWPPAQPLAGGPKTVNALSFSPDNQWLIASGTAKNVYVWNVETGELAHQLETANGIAATALTRDGRWLAVVGDDHIARVWK